MEDTQDKGRRRLADIRADLAKPIPKRLLDTKRKGGAELTFCPWYSVQRILDHYTNGYWHYYVKEKTWTDQHFMMSVQIDIEHQEGAISRQATGIESLDTSSYGDMQSNAESMAFRRAAARFGLGLHLYDA
jgi:hypothetical protein